MYVVEVGEVNPPKIVLDEACMNLHEAEDLAWALMSCHDLDGEWSFEFDRAKRRFGHCRHDDNAISLSKHLTKLNDREEVNEEVVDTPEKLRSVWEDCRVWFGNDQVLIDDGDEIHVARLVRSSESLADGELEAAEFAPQQKSPDSRFIEPHRRGW
jgi:hypothetical protein